ncbi:PREDICTED: chemokine XC receptor 1 [Gavialis gangeticus]|uniref:chemokine XC receptor 1 n=1 Tax=Gavialis gangeticus TaxID=94835 RepID=UPI00092ED087|nr:PREDICTED: chemokine XC receptor 1 [Gavialis gangeticus]
MESTTWDESIYNNTFDYYTPDNSSDVSNLCEMYDLSLFSSLLTTILYSLAFLFSLQGNSLVLWILMKYENLTSLTNVFIMNLCISDLVFSCMLPFWIVYSLYGWIFGDVLCRAVNAVFSISYYSGIFCVTMMTILRYLLVVNPLSTLRTHTRQYGVQASLIIWTFSILIVVPEIMYTQKQPDFEDRFICDYSDKYWKDLDRYMRIVSFLFSFIVTVYCYLRILTILLRSRSQRKQRTVRLILIIVVSFIFSWAPYNIVSLMLSFPSKSCQFERNINIAFYISRKIAFSHCCLNPVLYVFVGVKFRRHLRHLCSHYWTCMNGPVASPKIPFHGKFHYEDASIY